MLTTQVATKRDTLFSAPFVALGIAALFETVIWLAGSPPSSWTMLLAIAGALFLVQPFQLSLGDSPAAPRVGVSIVILQMAVHSDMPFEITGVWVIGIFLSQLFSESRILSACYSAGFAAVGGSIFVSLQIWLLDLNFWLLPTILIASTAYYVYALLVEWLRRIFRSRSAVHEALGGLIPSRIIHAIGISTVAAATMHFVDESLIDFLESENGVNRSPLVVLTTALVFYAFAQRSRFRRVAQQLSSVVDAAVDLPNLTGDEFTETLTSRAQQIVHASDVTIHTEPAARHEISAPVTLKPNTQEYLVASRKAGGQPFSREDSRALGVMAHAATQAAAMRFQLEDLERRANTDTLTGLPNYGAFQKALHEANTNRMYHDGIGLLFIDLDNFKQLNDNFGHRAGDQLLQAIAARLLNAAGGGDVVARVGGDEFVVILTGLVSLEQAKDTAERIVHAVSQPLDIEGHDRRPVVSAGLAYSSHRELDAQTLVEDADRTMLHVKRSRKDIGATESSLSVSEHRSTRTNEIVARAIRNRRLMLAFQPIVNVDTGKIWAFEALMRYVDPELGPISPPSLVARAKSLGLLNELTQQVITMALNAAEKFREIEPSITCITVNLELGQITDAELGPFIKQEAASHPDISLCIELNERSLHSATSDLRADAEELQEAGIIIALDDYGSDESSVRALVHFPFNVLKIDKTLINNLDDPRQRELVEALQSYGDKLGFTMVVEGVENQAMAHTLSEIGVRSAQGYHYGRPMFEQLVIERLRRDRAQLHGGGSRPLEQSI